MKNLKIGEKLTRIPLIQGGMGVGISLGRLAGAVAKEGGVGIISTAQIGYREPDFDADPAEANLRAIESEMKKAPLDLPGRDHRIQRDDCAERTCSPRKSGCQGGRGYHHIRSRTADRSSCPHRREQYEDRSRSCPPTSRRM